MVDVGYDIRAPRRMFGRLRSGAALLALLACSFTTSAKAEVTIEGSVDALRVEARDSSIADVLDALGASFELIYPEGADLSRPVSRSLSGDLRQVIARLLEKYDYVAISSPSGGVDIIWISPSGRAEPGAAPVQRITRSSSASTDPAAANTEAVKRAPEQMMMSPRVRTQMQERAERLRNARALRQR